MDNPFFYSRPIVSENFIGRDYDLRTLMNRANNGESIFVSGQPRIGKTSLLLKFINEAKKINSTNHESRELIPVLMERGCLDSSASNNDFWKLTIKTISECIGMQTQGMQIDSIHEIKRFFSRLASDNKSAVILIDGLGWLLENENFNVTFWDTLRELSTSTNGLVIIPFSRLNILELQSQLDQKKKNFGSPVMNFVIQLTLRPFSYNETVNLIDKYLGSSQRFFTPKDKRTVWQLSGGHPFLVQLVSSLIWEARNSGESVAKAGYDRLISEALEIAGPHFWDVWRCLDPTAQTLGLMISLREIALSQKYDTRPLDDALKVYKPYWGQLESGGLILIEKEVPILSSLCFGMWILQNQIGLNNEIPQPEEYLQENLKVFGPFTRKQIDLVAKMAGKIYQDLKQPALDLGTVLARARLGIP